MADNKKTMLNYLFRLIPLTYCLLASASFPVPSKPYLSPMAPGSQEGHISKTDESNHTSGLAKTASDMDTILFEMNGNGYVLTNYENKYKKVDTLILPRATSAKVLLKVNQGYQFERWKINSGTATILQPTDTITDISVSSGRVTISAVFRLEGGDFELVRKDTSFQNFPEICITSALIDSTERNISGLDSGQFTVLQDKEPVNFTFSTIGRSKNISIVLVMDVSGSMGDSNKLTIAQNAATDFISQLKPEDEVALVSFHGVVYLEQELTTDKEKVIKKINNLGHGGSTAFLDGANTGVEEMKRAKNLGAVIIFSDGEDTDSRISLKEVINNATANEVVIYSIGIGRVQLGFEATGLIQLATETGGAYFTSATGRELLTIYNEIRFEISSLYLTCFESPDTKMNGDTHTVAVEAKEGGKTFMHSFTWTEPNDPPVITLSNESKNELQSPQTSKTPLELTAIAKDDGNLDSVRLYYKKNGDDSHVIFEMKHLIDDYFKVTIPAEHIQEPGGEFYLYVRDNKGLSAKSENYAVSILNTPPVLAFTPETIEKMKEVHLVGTKISILVEAKDNSRVDKVELRYLTGKNDTNTVNMQPIENDLYRYILGEEKKKPPLYPEFDVIAVAKDDDGLTSVTKPLRIEFYYPDTKGPELISAKKIPSDLQVIEKTGSCFKYNPDTLLIKISERLAEDFYGDKRESLFNYSKKCKYEGSITLSAADIQVKDTDNLSWMVLIADRTPSSPDIGDCFYFNRDLNVSDKKGNPADTSHIVLEGAHSSSIAIVRPYPPIVGHKRQYSLPSCYAELDDGAKWLAPVGFDTEKGQGRKTCEQLPGPQDGLPKCVAAVQVLSKGSYRADVSISNNLGLFITNFRQSFGDCGELLDEDRYVKDGLYLSYLAWNLKDSEGHRVGNGVYIWKIEITYEDNRHRPSETIILRTGVSGGDGCW